MNEIKSFESMELEKREDLILKLVDADFNQSKKVNLLKSAFKDSHDSIRIAAVKTAKKLNISILFEDINALFQQEKQWLVRYYILKTLNSLDSEKAEDTLIKALKDKKPNIRIIAIELLHLNKEKTVNEVINLTRDMDSRVSEKAFKILENSNNSIAKKFIEDRERKIREKEEKRKQIEELFGDLINSEKE